MSLTPEQFARIEQLFAEALALSLPLRSALLARVREQEGAVVADRLQALLAAHSQPTESMFQPSISQEVLLPAARSAFKEGDLLLKRFRIIRLLGRGGMGEVYEAHDSEIGPVALKTIRKDVSGDSSLLRRFKREVQLARMVTSPFVCRIHEFFTLPEEEDRPAIAFLTMEFLEGTTLADRIAREGPVPWPDAEAIALQLCQGLEAIHSAGIIHRDFKSRNLMLTTHDGAFRAVVMDLGLAHRSEIFETPRKDRTPLTLSGTIMGTPNYMAPEQFEGGAVRAATDIYAFGVVLYEMVTGKLPFEASTPMAAAVRRAKRPPSVSSIQPGVPHRWDTVIERCLEYEPGQRFQSAAELAAALRRPSAITANLRALTSHRLSLRWLGLLLSSLGLLGAVVLGLRSYQVLTAHKVPEAAQAFYRQATEAFQNGNYLTASRQLQEAVQLDPDFVLAHARLADAFNELDSTGEAQREVNQIKEELVSQLSRTQRTYVYAVRESVRPDASAALTDYEKLLGLALPAERANALVDLGRANERAGKIDEATERYGQAGLLAPYSPTPFLRRGILESRQGKRKEADADFAKANKLYATNINLEGIAEVDYQRSYVASKLGPGHDREAREFFQESLAAAEKMESIALRVRALSRLSAIEFGEGRDEEAGKVANEAIHLAEENGVAYWATDARLRLGNSWIYRDAREADRVMERARAEAQRNQWPRLLALSQLSLAALADRQGGTRQQQQQIIDLASPAYDYYRIFGFAQESFQCQVLLSRAKSFFGRYIESLQHSQKALEIANNLASPTELLQAEEAVGTTLSWKEDYPAALDHFTVALHFAQELPAGPLKEYYLSVEALLRADALYRLGRIEDAKLAVAAVPEAAWKTDTRTTLGFAHLQAALLRSEGRYKEALLVARKALHGAAASSENWDLQLMVADGLTRTGDSTKALALCDEILAQSGEQSPIVIAEAKQAKARALLELRKWHSASALAEEAGESFRASGKQESELVSLFIAERGYRGIGSMVEANAAEHKIQDILAGFKHNYGVDNYQVFVRRSEIAEIVSGEDQ